MDRAHVGIELVRLGDERDGVGDRLVHCAADLGHALTIHLGRLQRHTGDLRRAAPPRQRLFLFLLLLLLLLGTHSGTYRQQLHVDAAHQVR
jgi:hypothetical protein